MRAVEWRWWKNVHYNLWAGVMVHLNEWECESASVLWQHEKWRNNGLNRMYSSVTIISILAFKYHLLLHSPHSVHPYNSLFVLLTRLSHWTSSFSFVHLFNCAFFFSAGWEYPRCAPAVGCSYVWTPGVHDPCIWPEKWNKVNAAHTYTHKDATPDIKPFVLFFSNVICNIWKHFVYSFWLDLHCFLL